METTDAEGIIAKATAADRRVTGATPVGLIPVLWEAADALRLGLIAAIAAISLAVTLAADPAVNRAATTVADLAAVPADRGAIRVVKH